LTRHLRAAHVEVNQPDKASRRRRGNTDAIDAEAAAWAVLSGQATATAKSNNGPVEMVCMVKLAQASAVKSRTRRSTNSRPCSSALTPCCATPWPG